MRNKTRILPAVIALAALGCTSERVPLQQGTLTSDALPVEEGELAWAAEVVEETGAHYAYLIRLDAQAGVVRAGRFVVSEGTWQEEMREEITEYGDLWVEAGGVRFEFYDSGLVVGGQRSFLTALPAPGEPAIRLPLIGNPASVGNGDIGRQSAAIAPKYRGCCEDCYWVHRRLGLPRSMDRFCCLLGGGCSEAEFPCDPDTDPDGCECDTRESNSLECGPAVILGR